MTVLSNDRPSWLTKLERIGEISASNKSMVFNNIGYLVHADMLKEQFHKLDGTKAIGIDKVTKAIYGEALDENIKNLIKRLRRGTYRPKPARITEIPKEDGSTRPLAISCLEDKLVQMSVSTILDKIYEPLFLTCSYGYRPGKSCHGALKALNQATYRGSVEELTKSGISRLGQTIRAILLQIIKNVHVT